MPKGRDVLTSRAMDFQLLPQHLSQAQAVRSHRQTDIRTGRNGTESESLGGPGLSCRAEGQALLVGPDGWAMTLPMFPSVRPPSMRQPPPGSVKEGGLGGVGTKPAPASWAQGLGSRRSQVGLASPLDVPTGTQEAPITGLQGTGSVANGP